MFVYFVEVVYVLVHSFSFFFWSGFEVGQKQIYVTIEILAYGCVESGKHTLPMRVTFKTLTCASKALASTSKH